MVALSSLRSRTAPAYVVLRWTFPRRRLWAWILGTLLTLFSQTESPRLEHAHIGFSSYHSIDSTTHMLADIAETVSAFRAVLSRAVFAELPPAAVTVSVRIVAASHWDEDDPLSLASIDVTLRASSATTESFIVPLFRPWLARGVVVLELPDGSCISECPPQEGDQPLGESASVSSAAPPLLVFAAYAIASLLVAAYAFVLSSAGSYVRVRVSGWWRRC
ncbi:uncharacterized protein B0H18DRAFT_596998 [Fomitopsis serialis]|uniref:uncharacterized protein n=1 Tax=Fomitopsis serialis TaxID=139415 RepID=UPI0020080DF2|nr:uncharacterized protein B0H18DRAFT_596998 [Neoantrodia serialis]KAH9920360.1 hypothetical protein B0H18DRAFT_596998 [Neoantrodia serialis]